jgi:undecaprenyl pyrophosphate phosphatase UppP
VAAEVSELSEDTPSNRDATADEILAVVLSVIILIVPIFLIVVFPDNGVVSTLFGNGRIILFWVVVYGLVFIFRKDIDEIGADWARRRREKGS